MSAPDYISDAEIEDWFDSIDASVFSGDAFHDENNRERALWYMRRWMRAFDQRSNLEKEDGDE